MDEFMFFIHCILGMFIAFMALFMIFYEIDDVDYDLEIKRLKKIIKDKNKEINELKNLNGYIYDNYIIKEKIK